MESYAGAWQSPNCRRAIAGLPARDPRDPSSDDLRQAAAARQGSARAQDQFWYS